MRKIITEQQLKKIIRKQVNEALKYNKSARRYFPDFTGDAHSDAGKFAHDNRDEVNYSRNDFKWSDPERQRNFERLQYQNDLDPNPFNPDEENEFNASEYLNSHNADGAVERATEELKPFFLNGIKEIINQAKQKYPIMNNYHYYIDIVTDVLDDVRTTIYYNI